MPPIARLRRHRRTKIVATLGPASRTPEVIERLFRAGADVFRLNFSHGSHADHAENIAIVRALEAATGRPIGLLADVQGPKLRIGRFGGGRVHLSQGQEFRLDMDPTPGGARRVQLPHPEILTAASAGSFVGQAQGRAWRPWAHVATVLSLGGVVLIYWPSRA